MATKDRVKFVRIHGALIVDGIERTVRQLHSGGIAVIPHRSGTAYHEFLAPSLAVVIADTGIRTDGLVVTEADAVGQDHRAGRVQQQVTGRAVKSLNRLRHSKGLTAVSGTGKVQVQLLGLSTPGANDDKNITVGQLYTMRLARVGSPGLCYNSFGS